MDFEFYYHGKLWVPCFPISTWICWAGGSQCFFPFLDSPSNGGCWVPPQKNRLLADSQTISRLLKNLVGKVPFGLLPPKKSCFPIHFYRFPIFLGWSIEKLRIICISSRLAFFRDRQWRPPPRARPAGRTPRPRSRRARNLGRNAGKMLEKTVGKWWKMMEKCWKMLENVGTVLSMQPFLLVRSC